MKTRSYINTLALELTVPQKQEMVEDLIGILRLHQDMEIYLEEFIDRYISNKKKLQEGDTGLNVIMNVASVARDMQEDLEKADRIRIRIHLRQPS